MTKEQHKLAREIAKDMEVKHHMSDGVGRNTNGSHEETKGDVGLYFDYDIDFIAGNDEFNPWDQTDPKLISFDPYCLYLYDVANDYEIDMDGDARDELAELIKKHVDVVLV